MTVLRTILSVVLMLIGSVLIGPVVAIALSFFLFTKLMDVLSLVQKWALDVAFRAKDKALPMPVSWSVPDPKLGWTNPRSASGFRKTRHGDLFHVETCADGWRGRHSISEAEVITLGDSYAYAYGVDSHHAYFAGAHGPRIKPIAAIGWSMVQPQLALLNLPAEALKGKLVVWFVCTGNDLADGLVPAGLGTAQPFCVEGGSSGWRVETEHTRLNPGMSWPASAGPHRNLKLSEWSVLAFHRPGHLSDRGYSAAEALLVEASRYVAASGGQLVIVSTPYARETPFGDWQLVLRRAAALGIPSPETLEYDYVDRRFSQICATAGVQYVSGYQLFGYWDYINGDGHWNEQGNRKVRKLIRQLYKRSARR